MEDDSFDIFREQEVAPSADMKNPLPGATNPRQDLNQLIHRIIGDELLGFDIHPEGIMLM